MTNTTYALERSTNGIQWSDVTAITTNVSGSDNLAYDIVCDAAMGLYRLKITTYDTNFLRYIDGVRLVANDVWTSRVLAGFPSYVIEAGGISAVNNDPAFMNVRYYTDGSHGGYWTDPNPNAQHVSSWAINNDFGIRPTPDIPRGDHTYYYPNIMGGRSLTLSSVNIVNTELHIWIYGVIQPTNMPASYCAIDHLKTHCAPGGSYVLQYTTNGASWYDFDSSFVANSTNFSRFVVPIMGSQWRLHGL